MKRRKMKKRQTKKNQKKRFSKESFKERVLRVVTSIKKGETRTYRHVAEAAGNGKAARAVGAILRTNFNPLIPCHRVIQTDGSLGGYNRGMKKKKRLLREERVRI